MDQRTKEWFSARVGKLTASQVCAALGVNPWKSPDDLIRSMVRDYHGAEKEWSGNIATEYGTLHEPLAIMEYMGKTGNHPIECGFFVHPIHEWLGASPDALIDEDGGLEVKCPFSLRNKAVPEFKTAAEQEHYYAQMQVEMACTNREWFDFYQWAPKGDSLERVYFDHGWWNKKLPAMQAFYERYLSELDNPAHLEPLAIEVNTFAARSLIEEYDDLSETIGNAESRKKEIMAELVKMAKDRNAIIHGRKLTKIERKGNIQYAKVPEIQGLDLEPYRAKSSEFWKLS